MVTTYQAIGAISERVGFTAKRVRHVARELTEAGTVPAGSPGKSPELQLVHFLDILIGSALDVPLRSIAETVAVYKALGQEGHDASGMPENIRAQKNDAGSALNQLAGNHDYLTGLKIEVVTSWPEIAIHYSGGQVRFREASSLPNHWQSGGHRTSTTINGASLAAAIRDLFGDNNAN